MRGRDEIEQYLEIRGHPEKVAGKVIATAPGQLEIDFTPIARSAGGGVRDVRRQQGDLRHHLHNKINEVAFGQPFSEERLPRTAGEPDRAALRSQRLHAGQFPKMTCHAVDRCDWRRREGNGR